MCEVKHVTSLLGLVFNRDGRRDIKERDKETDGYRDKMKRGNIVRKVNHEFLFKVYFWQYWGLNSDPHT
jgi:hypothetical protein